LEADSTTHFNNAATISWPRDFQRAGHARDAYDAAEAGLNIYLAHRLNFKTERHTPVASGGNFPPAPRQDKRDHLKSNSNNSVPTPSASS
jgi:hypothetical protein